MVFEIINWKWGDVILKAHCFHCCNKEATFISSFKVHDWLTSCECLDFPRSNCWYQYEFSVYGPVNAVFLFIATAIRRTWALLRMFCLNKLVLSGSNDENLCKSPQMVAFHKTISKHVPSFLVIIILESNTRSVKWTINKSKPNVGVVANHVATRFRYD